MKSWVLGIGIKRVSLEVLASQMHVTHSTATQARPIMRNTRSHLARHREIEFLERRSQERRRGWNAKHCACDQAKVVKMVVCQRIGFLSAIYRTFSRQLWHSERTKRWYVDKGDERRENLFWDVSNGPVWSVLKLALSAIR
jgi:hypothetical protein